MKYQVILKDTDSDTGNVSQLQVICECQEKRHAEMISHVMTISDSDNPNREYFVEERGKIETAVLCIDSSQVETAWACQEWLKSKQVDCFVCFSKKDLASIKKIYEVYDLRYMVVQTGTGDVWKGCEYDLKLGEFIGPDDFEVVYSVME